MKVPPKKPQFYKPIVPGFKNGLKIPTGFLKYLKGHKHERAVLRRGCKKWLVKLNGRRLEEGWEKFAEDHDLHLGDILVFRHEGDMEFDVSIFDSSKCDREYPEYLQDKTQEAHTVEETFKNFEFKEKRRPNDIKSSKKSSFHAKAATNHHKPLGQSRFVCTVREYCLSRGFLYLPKQFAIANGLTNKKCNLILKDEGRRSWNLKLSYWKAIAYIGDGWSKLVVDKCLKEGDRIMFEIVTSGETPIWKFQVVANGETPMSKFQGTRDFIRKKPTASGEDALPYFISTIKSYCITKSIFFLPMNFAKSNGLINRKCEMIVKDEAQRSWSVWIGSRGHHFGILRGWNKFKAANGLHVGDTYKFELIKNGKIPEAYFHYLRGSPSIHPEGKKKDLDATRVSDKGLDSQEKPESNIKTSGKFFPNVEAAKDMHRSHPHFICTIQSYSLSRHFLCVPRQFALETCLNNRKCEIIIRDERRSWTCNLYSSGRQTYIGSGWCEFRIANCLKEGDCLMFEIVSNGEKPIFRFYDMRGSQSLQPEVKKKNLDTKRTSAKGIADLTIKISDVTAPKSQVASSTYDDANPNFVSTIQPYTINKHVLYLPPAFAKSSGLVNRCCEMILIDRKRRSWSVQIGSVGRHYGIKSGLLEFIKANGVQVGDIYKFELINNGRTPIAYFRCKHSGKDDKKHRSNRQDKAVGDGQGKEQCSK